MRPENKRANLRIILTTAFAIIVGIAITIALRHQAPSAHASADQSTEALWTAFEQARDYEFGLQADGADKATVVKAAYAADAALKAYNDAVAAQQGLPLVTAAPLRFIHEVEDNNPLTGGTPQFLDINPTTRACAIVDGAISPAGDIDVFRVNTTGLTNPRLWVYVDTGGTQNPGAQSRDSSLRILRSDVTVIDTDLDDGTGNGLDLTTETGLSSTIGGAVLSGSADNNYYIEVNEFFLDFDIEVIDPYRLFVVITTSTPAAENNTPNNTKTTPDTLITAGQTLGLRSGAVSPSTDVDWYSIAGVEAGDVIYVNLEGVIGRNLLVDLFLPSNMTTASPNFTANSAGITGIPVAESVDPGEGFAYLAQTPGTYLLKVRRQAVFLGPFPIDFGPGSYEIMAALCRYADLQVTKTAPSSPVTAGTNITYTVDVTNNGPATAKNVVITDTLPTNTSFVSAMSTAGTPMHSMGVVTTNAGDIAPMATVTLTITVTVSPSAPDGSTLTNVATATSSTADQVPSNNDSTNPNGTTTTTVAARADLTVTKSGSPGTVQAGGNITYTITVSNLGPSDAQNVQLTDMIPANTSFVSFQQQPSGPTFSTQKGSGNIQVSAATMPAGSSATFTLVVMVNCSAANNSTISNTASVSSTTTDPGPNPNSAMTMTTVTNPLPVFTTPCPAPITTVTAPGCPPRTGTVVSYVKPTATDQNKCPVSVACSPDTGSTFPVGTTTVTCTATDAANQSVSCSFAVTVFNACLQDDARPGNVVLFNTFTGEYVFCCGSTVKFSGRGAIIQQGCVFTLTHNAADRRIFAKIDFAAKRGNASLQNLSGPSCTIGDTNITNNTCNCTLP